MQRKVLKLICLTLILSLVLSLICVTIALAAKKVKLTAMNVTRGPADKWFEEEFEKLYPNIDLEFQNKPWPDIYTHIQVAMEAGRADPDCIITDAPLVFPYTFRGWLLPLDDLVDPERIKDTNEGELKAARYQGKLMAMPITLATSMWYYNKDMFDEAGLAYPPEAPESPTWEYIVEAAKKLVKKDASGQVITWGMIIDQEDRPYEMLPLIGSLGGKYVSDDGLSVKGIITSQPWKEAFKWYADLYLKWKVSPNTQHPWAADMFVQGKVAQMSMGPWALAYLWDQKPKFRWGITGFPHFAKGKVVYNNGGWRWGVNPRTDVLDAAIKFVNFMTTPEVEWKWFRDYHGDFPASNTIGDRILHHPDYDEWPLRAARLEILCAQQDTVARARTPAYLEYETIFIREANNIRHGKDIDTALQDMERDIELEMQKYR